MRWRQPDISQQARTRLPKRCSFRMQPEAARHAAAPSRHRCASRWTISEPELFFFELSAAVSIRLDQDRPLLCQRPCRKPTAHRPIVQAVINIARAREHDDDGGGRRDRTDNENAASVWAARKCRAVCSARRCRSPRSGRCFPGRMVSPQPELSPFRCWAHSVGRLCRARRTRCCTGTTIQLHRHGIDFWSVGRGRTDACCSGSASAPATFVCAISRFNSGMLVQLVGFRSHADLGRRAGTGRDMRNRTAADAKASAGSRARALQAVDRLLTATSGAGRRRAHPRRTDSDRIPITACRPRPADRHPRCGLARTRPLRQTPPPKSLYSAGSSPATSSQDCHPIQVGVVGEQIAEAAHCAPRPPRMVGNSSCVRDSADPKNIFIWRDEYGIALFSTGPENGSVNGATAPTARSRTAVAWLPVGSGTEQHRAAAARSPRP